MNVRQTFKIGATAIVLTAGLGLVPTMARATCLSLGGGAIEICSPKLGSSSSGAQQVARSTTYIVRELNPFTGGVESTYNFRSYDEAARMYDRLSRVHWAEWKYAGIGEQWHRRRFSTSSEAQSFLASNPCPGLVCVIKSKRVVAGRVDWQKR